MATWVIKIFRCNSSSSSPIYFEPAAARSQGVRPSCASWKFHMALSTTWITGCWRHKTQSVVTSCFFSSMVHKNMSYLRHVFYFFLKARLGGVPYTEPACEVRLKSFSGHFQVYLIVLFPSKQLLSTLDLPKSFPHFDTGLPDQWHWQSTILPWFSFKHKGLKRPSKKTRPKFLGLAPPSQDAIVTTRMTCHF